MQPPRASRCTTRRHGVEHAPSPLATVAATLFLLTIYYGAAPTTLYETASFKPRPSCPPPPPYRHHHLSQILDGLEHLHAHGIAHRDLKPENICFVDDSRRALKLIDLGAAAFITPAGFTDLAGTPIYAAPEICPWFFQEEGSEPSSAFDARASMSWDSLEEEDGLDPSPLSFVGVGFPGPPTGALQPAPRPPSPGDTLPAPYGEAVDFWAAGVLLYVILSGESPFNQEKDVEDVLTDIAAMRPRGVAMESDVWGSISDAAKDLVHCLMEPSPERRYNGARVREHIWLAPFAIAAAPPIPARGPPGLPRPSPHAMPAGLGWLSPAANGTGASAAGHCALPTPANHNDPELSLALSYLPHALAPSHWGLQGDLRLLLVPEATTVGRVIAMTIQFTPRGVIVLPGRAEEPPSALAATTRGALMRWLSGEAAFTHAARPPAASLAPRFIAAFAPDRRSYRAHLAAAAARERTPGGRMLAASPAGLHGGRDDGKLVRTPGPFIGRVLSFGMRRSKSAGQLATEELPQHLHRRSSPEVLSPRPSGGRQQQ